MILIVILTAISRVFTYGFDTIHVPIGSEGLSALPYNVPGSGTEYSITPDSSDVTVNKYVGRLHFQSNNIKPVQSYRITLKYAGKTQEVTINVDFQTGISGDIVSYLSIGYLESYQFVKDVPLVLQNFLDGVPTKCSVTPALPTGLSYNSNGLTGSPTTASDTIVEYTFRCENQISVTNTVKFSSSVHNKLLPGILVTYFRYVGPNGLPCTSKYPLNAFHHDDIEIEVQRVEEVVDRPYNPLTETWVTGSDLFLEFGATYIGYLLFPGDGVYTFSTESDDGNWLILDGEMIMANGGCRQYLPRVETIPQFFKGGYHYLIVNYFQKPGGTALRLFWKGPNIPSFVVIPLEQYWYAPKFVFDYSTTYFSFNLNANAYNMTPIFYDVPRPTSFSVSPNIASLGLSLNPTTGEITGKATTTTKNIDQEFKVTTTINGKEHSVTLYFDTKDDQSPYKQYISWSWGIYYKLPDFYIQVFPNNYIDFRLKYLGRCYRSLILDRNYVSNYEVAPGQSILADPTSFEVGVLGFWALITKEFNSTVTVKSYHTGISSPYTEVKFVIDSREKCDDGYFRLEVFGFGYKQQSHIGFIFQIEDVGGRILFGSSVKNDGFDSRVGKCVVPGTYTVGGQYDNDNINDRPRLEIWIEKVKFTTIYGTAKTFKGTFIVGSVYCEADGTFNRTTIGESSYLACPTGQIGSKKRTCGFKFDVPDWFNVYDTCRSSVRPTLLHYGVSSVTVTTSGLSLLPYIDGDVYLYTISPALPNSCSINNSTGIITLVSSTTARTSYTIVANGVDGAVSTRVEITFQGTATDMNVYNLKFGYHDHFVLLHNSPISIPFYFDKGTPTSCKTDTSLPNGLSILPTGITGLVKSEDSVLRSYTITCENANSKTNSVKITTKIYKTLPSGALASYAKLVNDASLSCTTIYRPYSTPNSIVGLVRVEDNIDYPLSTTFEPWPGVFTDYRENFFVGWVFYLKIDTDGVYSFGIEVNKGVQMKIDGGIIIDNWGCGGGTLTTNELVLGAGYHLVDINFFTTTGAYGIIVYWKRPSDPNYNLIPKEYIYHLPAYEFTYKYQKTTYIINNQIQPNTPLVLDGIQLSSFTLNTPLPAGLSFVNGEITGTPTVHTDGEFLDYYVTAISSDGGKTVKAKITFAIVDYQPPYSFTIRYTGALKTIDKRDILMFVGKSISLTISANGGVNSFSIVPDLPNGLNFNTNSGILSGTCLAPFEINFQIGAINSGGLDKIDLRLQCANSCGRQGYEPIGVEIVNNNVLDLNYDVECEVNGEILYIHRPDITTPSFYSYCFRGGAPLKLSGSNYNLYPLHIKFYLLNTQFAEYTTLIGGGRLSTPFSHEIELRFETPIVTLGVTTYKLYTNEYLSIKPTVSGFYSVAYIDSSTSLPSGISLNTDTLEISGIASYRTPSTSYTLHVGTSTGTNTVSFTIEVTDCESSGKYSLSLTYFLPLNISTQSIEVKNNGESVQRFTPSVSDTYRYNVCVDKGSIQLELGSTSSSSWATGSSVIASINGAFINIYTKVGTGSTQSYTLTFPIFAIDPIGVWRYSSVYPGYTWNNVTFDENTMQQSPLNGITNYGGTTLYLRYKIVKSTNRNALGTYIRFGHTSGCILYVNGRELYRRNMAAGNATADTPASSTFGSITDITLFIPQVLFSLDENVLAVEYHKHATESPSLTLSFSGNYIITSEECIDLTPSATIRSTSGNSETLNPLTNAFDLDESTDWIETTKYPTDQPYVEFGFPANTYYWMDTYGFLSSADAMNNKNRNPIQINLETRDVSAITQLGEQAVTVVADSQPVTIKLFDEYKLYNSFKFTITQRVNPVADTMIADVLVRACHKTYCSPNGGFPATMMDTYSNISCVEGYVGYRTRYCNNQLYPNWQRADTTHCLPGPPTKLSYPYSQYSFFKGANITELIEPTVVSIGAVTFEITPQLPTGMRFDNSTGRISGIPNVRTDAQLYTVTVKNNKGYVSTTIYITIDAYECKKQGLWPNTERGERAEIDCVGGFIGKRVRFCKNTDPIEWDKPDESPCRIVRRPTVPGKGEAQLYSQVSITAESDVEIDSLLYDFFRIEFVKTVTTVDYNSIILVEEERSSHTKNHKNKYNFRQISEVKLGMYLAVAIDNINATLQSSQIAFDPPYSLQSTISEIYNSPIIFAYEYKSQFDYVPDKTNNTLVIALSVTFGLLFAILVTVCVWIRCKNRSTKTRGGSVKLKSAPKAAASTKPAGGGSGRSVRNSGSKKAAPSVRI